MRMGRHNHGGDTAVSSIEDFCHHGQRMTMTPQELGIIGEMYVKRLLSSIGLSVERGGPADLLVEGIPVEVKAARKRPYRLGRYEGYQFCLHRDGRGGVQAKVVVLLCYWNVDQLPVAFVIPAKAIEKRRKIVISGDPWTYSGKWQRWYRNWEVIADVVT